MKLNTLQDLLIEQLQDIYNAERQITSALPKMAKAATSPDLRRAFEDHLAQTERQIERLEQVFKLLDKPAKGKTCKGMEGLLEEGKELLEMKADPAVLDAGLIAAAQKVEHYEIASYGCVRTWARLLGHTQAATLLQQTLDEEAATDELLTKIAERPINPEAASSEVGGSR
jgi:ferritin-like metal-binding protein YciE